MMNILYKIKSKVIAWVADIRMYWWPMFFIFAGESHYQIKGPDQRNILEKIEPGDILLRRYDHYLGSVAIKGYWSHAAFYVGKDRIIHMLGKGITNEDVLTFMRCDNIMILRLKDKYKHIIPGAIDKAYQFQIHGVDYDYSFNYKSPKRFYCTEFVDNCIGYKVQKKFPNKKYILPDHFAQCTDLFDMIWTKKR